MKTRRNLTKTNKLKLTSLLNQDFTTLNGNINLTTETGLSVKNISLIDLFAGNVRVTTSLAHNLKAGDTITISGTNSDPNFNGVFTVTNVLDTVSFNITNPLSNSDGIFRYYSGNNNIATISNNTVKILINYMEKFKLLNQRITLNLAVQLCSNISFLTFDQFTKMILNKQLNESIKLIYEIYEKKKKFII